MIKRKNTVHNTKIQEILAKSHLLSGPEILKKYPVMDESTLYRNLKKLTEDGKVRSVTIEGMNYYELTQDKHHHFVCDTCHDVQVVHLDLNLPTKLPNKRGLILNADLTLRGTCAACS